ncbi:PIN domain-containing protein [Candidatus Woesearchaeota archaeon]|nr:PIN domain-containing protein [Candidatus Woesearchaeota archaeon]
MDLVVDANEIFAALIKESKAYELIFDERLRLFTTKFFFIEFKKHLKEIQKKTEKTEEELNHLFDVLRKKITLIPLEELLHYTDEAEKISPDPDDVAYIALALKLKCAIWSQDKKLKEKQNKVQVYSTEDLMRMF